MDAELAKLLLGLPADKRSLALRAASRRSFRVFAQRMLPAMLGGARLQWNWSLDAICHVLEQVLSGQTRRLIIEVPPRSLKSKLGSVLFPAFLMACRPGAKVGCASYSQALSSTLHDECRRAIRSELFADLFPGALIGGGRDSGVDLRLANGSERFATSTGGTLTGLGGDVLILDDCLNAADAMSETKRAALIEWFTGTVFSRLDHKASGAIVVISQRLHTDDLSGYLREQGGWEILSLPAIAQEDQHVAIGNDRVHLFKTGDVLHPERESRQMLDEIAATLGTYAYSAQYLQTPIPIDGGAIKWSWFSRYKDLPVGRGEIVQSWDIAMKDGPTNDYSVCTTWLVDGSNYSLVNVDRGRWLFPDLVRRVTDNAVQYRAKTVLIEDVGPGTLLIQQLRANKTAGVPQPTSFVPAADKLSRMMAETTAIEAKQVHLPESATWLEELRKELMQFPAGKHDDQVDSISQFLHWQRNRSVGLFRIQKLYGR